MFCVPELIFSGTEGVGSRFHVLRAWTHFRRCRVRQVPFSYFVCQDSLSAVTRASGFVSKFCPPGLVFSCVKFVGSLFHVLRSRTHFRRYRRRRVPFSCFARSESFSAVPRASGSFFMFFGSGLIFGGTDSIGSRFYVLRTRIHFRRY
jgi:hypothetical protein